MFICMHLLSFMFHAITILHDVHTVYITAELSSFCMFQFHGTTLSCHPVCCQFVCVWCDAVVCLSAKLLFELLGKLTNFSTDDAVIYSLWIKILASSRAYQMRRIEILKQLVPKKQVNYRRSQYYSDTKTYLRS